MIDRKKIRKKLLSSRHLLKKAQYDALNKQITLSLKNQFLYVNGMTFGCYWPYMGEYDFIGMMKYFHANGAMVSLPSIAEKKQPLKFKVWRPNTEMETGIFNIPVPCGHEYTNPNVLFVPLVGHDNNGFRLGYGGGYYDITLAALNPKPVTIGIGYEIGRLDSICPHPHDIPMDFIITEKGINYFNGNGCVAILKKNELSTLLIDLIYQRKNSLPNDRSN